MKIVEELKIPKRYMDLVGTKQMLSGGVFSGKRALPSLEYDVLNIRWGMATIINVKELQETGRSSYEYPTYELLIKNSGMKKSRWTRPFPVREINLNDDQSDTDERSVATAEPQ